MSRLVLIVSLSFSSALVLYAFTYLSHNHGEAALIGLLAGLVLYHASFGFTAGWRCIVRERRGRGLRVQFLLIGLICVVSYPLIGGYDELLGVRVAGTVLPMGVASALGAFLFGIGMQLGSGCASGTLFTAGGGSTRMMLVLGCFIAGSVWATYHWEFWTALPRTRSGISIVREFGPFGGLTAMLCLLAALWLGTIWIERRTHGQLERHAPTGNWLTGPWSLWSGAIGLSVVGILCFVWLGRPWGITAGFAVWGAQAVDALGGTPQNWLYWSSTWRQNQLEGGLLSTTTNTMNIGIILGAMGAAALAGRYAPHWRLSRRDAITAIIGGLLMGYGARLAYGCNIGAYLGGLTSGSLHGIWWAIWGFAGSYLGVALRSKIGMDPPHRAEIKPATGA